MVSYSGAHTFNLGVSWLPVLLIHCLFCLLQFTEAVYRCWIHLHQQPEALVLSSIEKPDPCLCNPPL